MDPWAFSRFQYRVEMVLQVVGNFVWSIINLERLISISNVGTFEFEDTCLIPHLKLSLQGLTTTGYRLGI